MLVARPRGPQQGAPRAPRGFLKVQLEGDPELDASAIAIAGILGKPVKALKSCTTEDDNGAYDRYVGKVQDQQDVSIPEVDGQASKGTLMGNPVILTNEWGMGTIWM